MDQNTLNQLSVFLQNQSQQIQQLQVTIQQLNNELNQMKINSTFQQASQHPHPEESEEFQDISLDILDPTKVSLDNFKSLPEFSSVRNQYANWRLAANNAMHLFKNHKDCQRYYEATNIVRNKIVGSAANVLTNSRTPFNFNAFISRLDKSYADNRPLYVLEHELMTLQQGKSSIEQFYNSVNDKLTTIVNKINMCYKEQGVIDAFIVTAQEKALRTFVTGLNFRRGELLYSSKPSLLDEAYENLLIIINDQERIKFVKRYSATKTEPSKQIQFQPNQTSRPFNPSMSIPRGQPIVQEQIEPMDIDKSSVHVNVGDKFHSSLNRPQSFQKKEFFRNAEMSANFANKSKF